MISRIGWSHPWQLDFQVCNHAKAYNPRINGITPAAMVSSRSPSGMIHQVEAPVRLLLRWKFVHGLIPQHTWLHDLPAANHLVPLLNHVLDGPPARRQ